MAEASAGHCPRLADIRREVFAEYRSKTPASAACFERARHSLAGGVSGNLRYFPPHPLYQSGGQGAWVRDLDGNEYLDCFLCNGPLLLGHRHPEVMAEIDRRRADGLLVVNPPSIVEAAERLQEIAPCAERVRLLNSGTEAVLTAVRCARAATGRSKVVKFRGHYHGQDDQFLAGIDATDERFGAGIPKAAVAATLLLNYGDADALQALAEAQDDIAAVILDPAMHAGGLWGSSHAYLQSVREVTAKHGIVLIFDEVITGLRLALGGAQSFYGVTPELATFGKALAAGERLAAVAGREELMRVIDPTAPDDASRMFQSGTANDGAGAVAATIGAMNAYRQLDAAGQYERLHDISSRLAEGLRQAFRGHGVPCHVNQLGPMLQLFLSDAAPTFANLIDSDTEALALFFLALINEGVILTLPNSGHIYLSFAHSAEDIEEIIDKANLVLNKYDFRPSA